MSETTNLKLFKHDNPATNENQFDVTKALNNNWEKIDDFAETTNTKITENQNNIKSLQTDNTTNKKDIATLKSDNTTNKQDIANLKTENEELKTEISNNGQNLELLNNFLPKTVTTENAEIVSIQNATNYYGKINLSGNTVQNTSQDNIPSFDNKISINNVIGTVNLFDGHLEQGGITTNTGINYEASNTIRSKNYIEIPENINKIRAVRSNATAALGLRFYNADKEFLGYTGPTYAQANIIDFNIPENTKYIRFIDNTNDLNSQIVITTDLCAYQYCESLKSTIFIKNTCKNIINQNEIGNYNVAISYMSKEDGKVKTTSNFSGFRDTGTYLKIKKNTQCTVSLDVISIETSGNNQGAVEILGHKATDSSIWGEIVIQSPIRSSDIGKRFSTTFNSGDYDFWTLHISGWYGSGNQGVLVYKDVQVEPEATATDFEEGSQQFKFTLEKGQVLHKNDYLNSNCIHYKRNTIVLNGSENWARNNNASTTQVETISFGVNINNIQNSDTSNNLCLANTLQGYLTTEIWNIDKEGIWANANFLYIRINRSRLETEDVEGLKTFLSTNNMVVEYPLVNETIEKYTEQQQSESNKLQKAIIYEDQNYTFGLNCIVPILNVSYTPKQSEQTKQTINCLGDSITVGLTNNNISYADYLQNLNVNKHAVSGTTIAKQEGKTNSFLERYSSMGEADIIMVMGGTNDCNLAVPVGEKTSTNEYEFYGALKSICSGLLKKYPYNLIFFATPIQRHTTQTNLEQYVEAIKEVCNNYNIPVLDLNRELNMNPNITEQYAKYYNDWLHPSDEGQRRIARKVQKYIDNEL